MVGDTNIKILVKKHKNKDDWLTHKFWFYERTSSRKRVNRLDIVVTSCKLTLTILTIHVIVKVSTFAEKLLLRDADADYGGVDDMTKLAYLNEPGVLDNLKKRYALNEIYVSDYFHFYFVIYCLINETYIRKFLMVRSD